MIRDLWYSMMRGTALDRALLIKRRAPLWKNTGVIFIHVPKAAGTSVSQALYGRFLGHMRASDVERWAPRAARELPMVAIARNPWDRLVSAYRFVRRGHGVGGPQAGGVWRPEQYRIPEFESFERFVLDWLSARNLRSLDYVFHPQSLFVCDSEGEILVDHLGRFEDLYPTYKFLREVVPGLPEIGKSNRSGAFVDYRGFYTDELARRVGEIYHDDVRNLNYSFDE